MKIWGKPLQKFSNFYCQYSTMIYEKFHYANNKTSSNNASRVNVGLLESQI